MEPIGVQENRELGIRIGMNSGETPGHVIESSAEVAEDVTDKHQQEIGWRLTIDDASGVPASRSIPLRDNFVWVVSQESGHFFVQGTQMLVCPGEFHGEARYRRCRELVHPRVLIKT